MLRTVWDEGGGKDGYVSMEVDPTLAYDQEATIAEALRFHEWIDKPNLFVKIPATEPGLGAIEECIARGRSINVTLIFGLDRYAAVAESYIRGLERLVEGGGDPSPVASVASFFVSRVDTEADKRLERWRTGAAAASWRSRTRSSPTSATRSSSPARAGRRSPRRARRRSAASGRRPRRRTRTIRDTLYVEELIGPATVNTMPLETIEAFQDHGTVADTLEAGLDEARELFAELERAGVDYDDVTDTLEREGVQKFSRLVRGAARRDQGEARASSRRRDARSSSGSGRYDASLWTDSGEDRWLGWLDVVTRVRGHVDELNAFSEAATEQFHDCVLLGMGGSSLAPEVLRRTFNVESFHVLDTTHPEAIRRLERSVDLEQTLFLASSKSGSTIETRSQLEYFWEQTGGRGAQFAAITDPGSELDDLAHERGFRAVFAGEPEIGGRYSALSMFGIVPAALMGVDVDRFLQVAAEMAIACHEEDGNPGPRARARARGGVAGRARQGLHRRVRHRLRALGRAAAGGVDGQAGQGARARAGRVAGRARPPARAARSRRPATTSPPSSTAGSSRPPSRATCSGSTRSTSRTCRRRRTRRTRCWLAGEP